ncbi:GNAT family N-acetyltransferase [Streptomyces sp. NPDC007903]|uniref:GNAT family N-acetyltransferase n=1 Tax=Streptomyces sp. NPDC007903 TaxID=3364786 RepID=UPI0036E18A9F
MTERTAVVRPLGRPGDLGWVVMAHGEFYDREFGWDTDFEALVCRIVADYADGKEPGPQAAWIAEVDGQRAGCVFCVRADDRTAKLRLLLVDPAARGLGVGARLIEECLTFAREAGYGAITLWTNDVLGSARRLYERHGFQLTAEDRHHSFGHDLVGQTWRLSL